MQSTNQQNAQHSTGPRTEAGKRRSSLNAFRHGLTGQTVVMPGEDMEAYQTYCKRAFDDLKPSGYLEEQAVQTIADSNWRLNRARAYESSLFSRAFADIDAIHTEESASPSPTLALPEAATGLTKSLANLSTYEHRLTRTLSEAKKELADLQQQRRAAESEAMDQAVTLRKYYRLKKIEWNPTDDGFVFTAARIDARIQADDRKQAARQFVEQHAKATA